MSPKLAALSPDAAEQAVLHGVTAALDRYSRYASPDVAQEQRAAREGFGGIGVTVDPGDAMFRVTAVTPQGPADRAGIRPEDQIVSVDGVATSGCLHQDVMHRLRGPVGTPVAVRILQAGMSQPRELRLNRAVVYEQTVTVSRNGGILVLRVNSFNHNTTKRIAEVLAEAQRQPGQLTGVVLDLRGNPGGLLDQAVSLADLFLQRRADRLGDRAPPGEPPAFQGVRQRRRGAPAAGGADQRRFGLRLRDRRRRAARRRPRRRDRQFVLRQRLGADRAAAAQQRRIDPDLGSLAGAVGLRAAAARRGADGVHRRPATGRPVSQQGCNVRLRLPPGNAPAPRSTRPAGRRCAEPARRGVPRPRSTWRWRSE